MVQNSGSGTAGGRPIQWKGQGGEVMTVRFSTGVSIQYNRASYAVRSANGFTDIYTEKDGVWIAQVSTSECVIEVEPACRVYNATSEPEFRLAELERQVRGLRRDVRKKGGAK